jgi:hypothetical protein
VQLPRSSVTGRPESDFRGLDIVLPHRLIDSMQ